MKRGFRIDIQSDLNLEQMKTAIDQCDKFIVNTLHDPKKRYDGMKSYGGRDTPYSRGSCLSLGGKIFFMRINRHKRVFGVLKRDLIDESGGFGKLKIKALPTMFTYAQVGDIKG